MLHFRKHVTDSGQLRTFTIFQQRLLIAVLCGCLSWTQISARSMRKSQTLVFKRAILCCRYQLAWLSTRPNPFPRIIFVLFCIFASTHTVHTVERKLNVPVSFCQNIDKRRKKFVGCRARDFYRWPCVFAAPCLAWALADNPSFPVLLCSSAYTGGRTRRGRSVIALGRIPSPPLLCWSVGSRLVKPRQSEARCETACSRFVVITRQLSLSSSHLESLLGSKERLLCRGSKSLKWNLPSDWPERLSGLGYP